MTGATEGRWSQTSGIPQNEPGTNGVNDRATRWRAFAAIGALLLSSLLGGCGEVASPDTTPEGGSPAQPSIEEVLAAIQAATPNPVTPEAVAETFALGTNATDVQREIMKQELVGSVVEWDLVVYDVKLLDGGQYQVTSQPVQIPSPAPLQHVAVVVADPITGARGRRVPAQRENRRSDPDPRSGAGRLPAVDREDRAGGCGGGSE